MKAEEFLIQMRNVESDRKATKSLKHGAVVRSAPTGGYLKTLTHQL